MKDNTGVEYADLARFISATRALGNRPRRKEKGDLCKLGPKLWEDHLTS